MSSFDANGSPCDPPPHDVPVTSDGKWSALVSHLNGFRVLGHHPFPAHLCVVQDPRESNVLLSTDDDYHIVVLVDRRFENHGYLRVMRPYTAHDADENETYLGWIDRYGNFASHGEHAVYEPDYAKVIAWKPCRKDLDFRA